MGYLSSPGYLRDTALQASLSLRTTKHGQFSRLLFEAPSIIISRVYSCRRMHTFAGIVLQYCTVWWLV